MELQQKLVVEKLMLNIEKAGNHTSELLEIIKKKNLNPVSAYLGINSWDDYNVESACQALAFWLGYQEARSSRHPIREIAVVTELRALLDAKKGDRSFLWGLA